MPDQQAHQPRAVSAARVSKLYAEQCAAEPIHLLGGIQPHGYLTVIDLSDYSICQVSEGIGRHYPRLDQAETLLGQPAAEWFRPRKGPLSDILDALSSDRRINMALRRRLIEAPADGNDWDSGLLAECSGYRSGGYAVLEWVPVHYDLDETLAHVQSLSGFTELLNEPSHAFLLEEYLQESASRLQALAGYQRVMVYRFLPDWSGDILAEATAEGVAQRFLGQRFPASDIPPQARALYLRNRLRVLADVQVDADALLPQRLPDGELLDQSIGLLRSMSTAHLSYLKNMGVRATLTISIIVDGDLWGMVACHHDQPMVPPHHIIHSLRASAELMSRVISTRVQDLARQQAALRTVKLRQALEWFSQRVVTDDSVELALGEYAGDLCDPLHVAHIGLLAEGGLAASFPLTPEMKSALKRALHELAVSVAVGQVVAWDSLPEPVRSTPGLPVTFSGLMMARLSGPDEQCVFWLRNELVTEVQWAGEPGKFVIEDEDEGVKLGPRRSFAIWRQTVSGRCESWTSEDEELAGIAARRLSECLAARAARHLQRSLEWASTHDTLTSLLNRNALQAEIKKSVRQGPMALLLIDLDHFKQINDTLGHDVGDEVLTEVSARLAASIRLHDAVGRLGGDEFLVLCRVSSASAAADEVARLTERLCEVIRKPVVHGAYRFELDLSIGIVVAPEHGTDADLLLKRADIALYEAKQLGRGRSVTYAAHMEAALRARFDLDKALSQAIRDNQLVLHYQPQIDLPSGRVVGCEALVRWQHPTQGLLMPGFFLPHAEQGRLIHDLGRWVINEAAGQLAEWNRSIDPGFIIAINASFAQVREGRIISEIRRAITEHGVNPANLQVELTESSVLGDEHRCNAVTQELKALGIKVALDDFGTGYSSLSHIHRLQFDCIKIDRSFVMQLERDRQAQAVVRSLLALANNLDVTVVGEGVEKQAHADWLCDAGCTLAQGFLWSPAVPAADFPDVLAAVNRQLASP